MDIPAHVVNATVIENHVKVEGGTNWDLSRSAVETPIYALKDPEPTQPRPMLRGHQAEDLFMRIHFTKNSAVLPSSLQKYLSMIPAGSIVALAAPDASSHKSRVLVDKRKAALRAALVRHGFSVAPAEDLISSKETKGDAGEVVALYLIK